MAASNKASALPNDVLFLICGQLWQQRDFQTLLQCALSGRQLAAAALTHIYRMHEISPVTTGSDEDQVLLQQKATFAPKSRQQEQIVRKWAGLWRTLILSSLDKTLFPYSKYVRALNLQDLADLLQDSRFRAKVSDQFFEGDLQRLRIVEKTVNAKTGEEETKTSSKIHIPGTLSLIGEVLTAETPLLEDLRGFTVPGEALGSWVPRFTRLKHLDLWYGEPLRNLGRLIRQHCPYFTTVKFWEWQNGDADLTLGVFLSDIRPQSIESLEIHGGSTIASMTFRALGNHSTTLTELALKSLSADAMQSLNLLKDCTNLTSLSLAEGPASTTDLENFHNDVFIEVVGWLQSCTKLKSIQLSRFFSGPALLTPILLEKSIHLEELELNDYVMKPAKQFHRALAEHKSLRSLYLKGEGDEASPEGSNILAHSLSQLENLTDLRLRDIAESFNDEHICALALNLPKLEALVTGGWNITDAVLERLRLLPTLKMLQFNAFTKFTAQGIMEFVLALGPENMGFSLSILMSEMDNDLSSQERNLIADTLASRVKGRFEFMTVRDPDESEFEADDSD